MLDIRGHQSERSIISVQVHTQFRGYSRNQQTALGVFTIRLGKKLEQRAIVNAWTNNNVCKLDNIQKHRTIAFKQQ